MYAAKCGIAQDGGWNSTRVIDDFPNLLVEFSAIYDKDRTRTGFIINDGHCEAFIANKFDISEFDYVFNNADVP
jgi:hypothetical protein